MQKDGQDICVIKVIKSMFAFLLLFTSLYAIKKKKTRIVAMFRKFRKRRIMNTINTVEIFFFKSVRKFFFKFYSERNLRFDKNSCI